MLKLKKKKQCLFTLPDDATIDDFQHCYLKLLKEYFARISNGQHLLQAFLKSCPTANALRNLSAEHEAELLDEDEAVMGPLLAAIRLGQVSLVCPHPFLGHAYSSNQLGNDLVEEMAACDQEKVIIALTDVHNEFIDKKVLFRGGLADCRLYPDRIYHYALQRGAKGIVMIHNHPTGEAAPSVEDLVMMRRLNKGCQLLGLALLDCLIIGKREYYSWRESSVNEEAC